MSENKIIYDGDLPVTEEWVAEHVGQWVTIHMATNFYELLECVGPDEWWEIMDQRLGVVLAQWDVAVVPWDRDEPADENILLAITGMVEKD